MKQMIAEDEPRVVGYDQSRFAGNLFYEEQSTDDAVTILT
jgi:hypothetical protein